MLDDAEIESPRLTLGTFNEDADALRLLMLGTLDDDTLRPLLLLDATGTTTTELLLCEVGKLTADDIVLELGRMLDSVTSTKEGTAGCEERTLLLIVREGTIAAVLLLRTPVVLEATTDWEVTLEVTKSATEEL